MELAELAELANQEQDRHVIAATTQVMLNLSFDYVDQVSEHMVSSYQSERDRQLLTQTAVRAARVEALLAQGDTDLDAAESALGYRLRQHHLALALWLTEQTADGGGLIQLDRLAAAMATELGCTARPLFVPRDESLAWAWLPLGAQAHPTLERLTEVVAGNDPTVRIAVGDPGKGLDGSRGRTCTPSARPPTQISTWPSAPANISRTPCGRPEAMLQWWRADLLGDQSQKRPPRRLELSSRKATNEVRHCACAPDR